MPGNEGHVFVSAAGFGKRVIPRASPYTLQLDESQSLMVGLDRRVVRVRRDNTLSQASVSLREVADVVPGPAWTAWWLDARAYRVPLPSGWTAHISGRVDPTLFDLVGPHDSMIFVQLPRRIPRFDRMIAPGQEFLGSGRYANGDWISVGYSEAGREYVQRHAVVHTAPVSAVVTLQCSADVLLELVPTHESVVDALQPGG